MTYYMKKSNKFNSLNKKPAEHLPAFLKRLKRSVQKLYAELHMVMLPKNQYGKFYTQN